jgi:Domain of unknown function (DUF1127).
MFDADHNEYSAYVSQAQRARNAAIADTISNAGALFSEMTCRVAGSLLHILRTQVSRVMDAHRQWRALRQLEALDDRLLKDIGLSRGSLPYWTQRAMVGHGHQGMPAVQSTPEPTPVAADADIAEPRQKEAFRCAA